MRLTDFTERKLLMLTGKGGTGKTSVSVALAKFGGMQGKRVLVAEVDSQRSALAEVFGTPLDYEPRQVAEGVWACNITFRPAMVDWLDRTVRAATIVKLILSNTMVQVFLDATPGAREIVVLSKVCAYLEEFDQVIVDLPASGHALGLFKVPMTAHRLMRAGPIHDRAGEIIEILSADDSALAVVGLPEEMVVNETVELFRSVREVMPDLSVPVVFLNRCAAPTMTDDEHKLLARLSTSPELQEGAKDLLLAGRWEADLERATAESLGRLHSEIGITVVPFPRLGILGGFEGGPHHVVGQMTAALRRRALAEVRRAEVP